MSLKIYHLFAVSMYELAPRLAFPGCASAVWVAFKPPLLSFSSHNNRYLLEFVFRGGRRNSEDVVEFGVDNVRHGDVC